MTCLLTLKFLPVNSHVSPVILHFKSLSYNVIEADYNYRFLWVPAHVGIPGNVVADDPVKPSSSIFVYLSEKNPVIDLETNALRRHVSFLWDQKWSDLPSEYAV